jgi:7-keto-8-aminopelargonate synthetase-like enzyme
VGKLGVLTESVFSMDGDVAPLREIVELKERWGAWLLVDEAHAVGVIGERGRGLADEAGVADRVEVQMGTLGKALGTAGGYVAGSGVLVDFLVNRARSLVFSTAPSPVVAAAAGEAVRLLDGGELEVERARLWANARAFAAGATSAIVPILVGDERDAVAISERLLATGFWVPAVRYPTVARGAARLRVTVSAAHAAADVAALRAVL